MVGCGTIKKVKTAITDPLRSPEASVVDASVVEQTAEGARVVIRVAVTNPNNVPLPLVSSSYTLDVNGTSYAFTQPPNHTLPRRENSGGKQTLELYAALPTNGQNLTGAGYRVNGSVTYQPPGEIRKVLTDSYVPLPWVSFNGEGTLGAGE